MRILIVEDHVVVREGFRRLLSDAFPGSTFGEAGTAAAALSAACAEPWDVVLLDLSLPGRGGLEALKDIKKERPALPVVVMTMHAEEQYAIRAFKGGAAAYLMKDAPPDVLFEAVRKVANGGIYVSEFLAEKLASSLSLNTEKALHADLSDREFEVLRMLAMGKSVIQIGRELSLSDKTIGTYRARMLEKMNLDTTAELIAYAIRAGLVD